MAPLGAGVEARPLLDGRSARPGAHHLRGEPADQHAGIERREPGGEGDHAVGLGPPRDRALLALVTLQRGVVARAVQPGRDRPRERARGHVDRDRGELPLVVGRGDARQGAHLAVRELVGLEQVGDQEQHAQSPTDADPLPRCAHLDVGDAGDPVRRRHGTGGHPLAGVGEVGGEADDGPLTRGPGGQGVVQVVRQAQPGRDGIGVGSHASLQVVSGLLGPPGWRGVRSSSLDPA